MPTSSCIDDMVKFATLVHEGSVLEERCRCIYDYSPVGRRASMTIDNSENIISEDKNNAKSKKMITLAYTTARGSASRIALSVITEASGWARTVAGTIAGTVAVDT